MTRTHAPSTAARRRRIAGRLAIAGVAAMAMSLPAAPALAASPTPSAGSWSTSKCGVDERTPEIPSGSFVKVVVTGAQGTWAWGVGGGTGQPGGSGSVLTLRSNSAMVGVRAFLARAGCTTGGSNSGDVAGGAGWSPGGTGQKGGGAGGGSSALCEDLWECSSANFENIIAVAGGGGGGGGGTCGSRHGWWGGYAGVTPLRQWRAFRSFSVLNGGPGDASPGSGAVFPEDATSWTGGGAGASYKGGQSGGATGGGGGFYVGGLAGNTYGKGCQSAGGGGGTSAFTANSFAALGALNWSLIGIDHSDRGGSVQVSWQPTPF